jgi:DNA-binding NtrC family response regulator
LRLLPNARPQLVLLDLRMPGMGGMQALQRIKALYPDVCVLMVTANDDRSTAQEALALGAADHLKKPLDLDYLDAVLEIYLTVSDAPPGTVFSAMAAAAQSSPTNSPTRRSLHQALTLVARLARTPAASEVTAVKLQRESSAEHLVSRGALRPRDGQSPARGRGPADPFNSPRTVRA